MADRITIHSLEYNVVELRKSIVTIACIMYMDFGIDVSNRELCISGFRVTDI